MSKSESIEDTLLAKAKTSTTLTEEERQLMEDAAREITRLRTELWDCEQSLDCAGERLMGEDI